MTARATGIMLGVIALTLAGCLTNTDSGSTQQPPTLSKPANPDWTRGHLALSIASTPESGPSAFDVVLSEDGVAVGTTRVTVPTRYFDRNRGAPLLPENREATIRRYETAQKKHADRYNAKLLEALKTPEIRKYPLCEKATPREQRGGIKIWFAFSPGLPHEQRVCFIFPTGPMPNAFVEPFSLALVGPFEISTLAAFDTGAQIVTDPDKPSVQDRRHSRLRPAYQSDAIVAAKALEPIGAFLKQSLPGTPIRRKVVLLASVVQGLEMTSIVRSPRGRLTPYPSPAAVLYDRRGPSDAKAVLLASLIQGLDPNLQMVMIELDDRVVLGIDVEAYPGDFVFKTPGNRSLVILDPNEPWPIGKSPTDAFSDALADGQLTQSEVDHVFSVSTLKATFRIRRDRIRRERPGTRA